MPFIAFTDRRNRLATDSVESDCHTARRTAVQRIDGGTRIFVCVTTSQALELGAGGKRRGETLLLQR